MDRKQHLYLWLAGLFVTALVVADLIGGRFFRIGSVDLSAGKRMKPGEKRQLVAAFDPEYFWILRIGVFPNENYRGRIFRSGTR